MLSNPLRKAIDQFTRVYKQNMAEGSYTVRVSQLLPKDQEEFWRRDSELHPSSFPYCGLRHAYELALRDDDPEINIDFGRDYYLPAGHVFHAAAQKWMGMSGQLIGDWKCQACGRMHKMQTFPRTCRKCKSIHLEYQELGGKWGKHVSWHTDGVFQLKNGKNWLIDFKTTSTYAIDQHFKTKQHFPYMANRFQIESYVPLVEDNYGIQIEGWMLVYCARDKPNSPWKTVVVGGLTDEDRKEELRTRLEIADRDFGRARKVKTIPIKVFNTLKKSKLCCDREFYKDYVHSDFDPCPLSKVCFNRVKLAKALEIE